MTTRTPEVGAALKAARLEAGFTWQAAADAIGVHRNIIWKHETGEHHTPRILVALGTLYGLPTETVDDLLAAAGAVHPEIAERWISDQPFRREVRRLNPAPPTP